MATQRPAFAKRDREMKLKDKARAKAEKRAARRAAPRPGHGPPIEAIEADDAAGEASPDTEAPVEAAAPAVVPTPRRPG